MAEAPPSEWHDFYLIVGGAAAGLTGLMFVVVSIAPGVIAARGAPGVRSFVTPTVVFFATVLLIAAMMTIPTLRPTLLGAALGLFGIGGGIYMIALRGHQQWRKSDLPRSDWFWYVGLPILSYLLVIGGAGGIWTRSPRGFDMIAGAVILLLVIGIRNAWDLVLWMAHQHHADKMDKS